jgi:hypothetical protein
VRAKAVRESVLSFKKKKKKKRKEKESLGPFRLAKKPELGPIIYWKRKVGTVTEK